MKDNKEPIFIALSPNVEKDDVSLALSLLFNQKEWKRDESFFEKEFQNFLKVKYAFAFNSGRSALLAILKSLNLKEGEEVLVQAFTCSALLLPILWAKLKPVFVDCELETLNLDVEDLKKKITKNSRVLIVQHTFGLSANMDEIEKICQERNIILIEDCAHSLGAKYKGKLCGTIGKASFFSFGRDKIISSVFGGMAVTNDEEIAQKIKSFKENSEDPKKIWVLQQLLHPILVEKVIKPSFKYRFGKGTLFLFQKLRILSKALSEKEKKGEQPSFFPKRMPGVLAILASHQLKKLQKFNQHRNLIANFYRENLSSLNLKFQRDDKERIYLRFPLLLEKKEPEIVLNLLKRENIFLDDGWRKKVIVPPGKDEKIFGYTPGSCQNAEKVAKSILNLPTSIQVDTEKAQRICYFLKNAIFDSRN